MNLILDAGNSYVKLAVFQDGTLLCLDVVLYVDFKIAFDDLFKKYNKIDKVVLSSVGELTLDVINALKKNVFVLEVSNEIKLPFYNLYKTPKTLGRDRLALVAASIKDYSNKNVLIIDAGTCITFDFINYKNQYLGGAISPGLNMRYKALNFYTTGLPLLEKEPVKQFLGDSTNSCMHSGVVNGVINEIEGVISQYRLQYEDLTVILTGGDANFLSKQLKSSIFANSNFLLEGLNYLLNYNIKE